jgi:ribosome-associated protein
MVDTVKTKEAAVEIARLIDEHRGEDTVVIDVSGQSSWTDFFVISTINSYGHLKGIVRQVKNHIRELDMDILHRHKRMAEDGWELIDCGYLVIHLMSREMRDFYDLEKLWFNGEQVYQSSKSSKSSPSS